MANLDDLPKAIRLIRAGADEAPVPAGFPVLVVIDQTALPEELKYLYITDWREVIDAIKRLSIRGAPAIGIAGACGLALRAAEYCYARLNPDRQDEFDFDRVFMIDEASSDPELYMMSIEYAAQMIVVARPTAVNLKWAVDNAMDIVREEIASGQSFEVVAERLFEFCEQLIVDDENTNRRIGENGAGLLPDDATVLTHCNAGILATAGFGTALGVIYEASASSGIKRVYSDETRPLNQGARLTVWELSEADIPVTLICDDMAAYVMQNEQVDAVIVGADRIALNGDCANKIGTLGVAILADHFDIPFYVAAPISTIDPHMGSGGEIPIEMRSEDEVLDIELDGVEVLNPAFDVTPAKLITSIITEKGVFSPEDIHTLFGK